MCSQELWLRIGDAAAGVHDLLLPDWNDHRSRFSWVTIPLLTSPDNGAKERKNPGRKPGLSLLAICSYLERTAITSISTNAQGAANAATCIAALAGLFGCSAVPKYCV